MLTGKGLSYGGSLARTQATGYGLCYFSAEALKHLRNDSYEGKTVIVSGSGNVAQYAAEKCTQLGGKVVAMSDSQGYIYDPKGIDLEKLFDIKQKRRARISVYAQEVPGSEYHEGCKNIWSVKCDIAHPCASQNEMDAEGAQKLVDNGCIADRARQGKRPALLPRQGFERRRRCDLRARNEPELHPHVMEL